MLRRRSLERRLFGWLFAVALVPAVVVLVGGAWATARALEWTRSLAPWEEVAESGRQLLDALPAEPAMTPELARAAERHRQELSGSLVLARRWSFIQRRIVSVLPAAAAALTVLLALLALLVSRRLSRQLTRPIQELVGWSERLAREAPLPPASAAEAGEVREVRALRQALRSAAEERVIARGRALEAERTRVWGEMARRVAHEMKNPLTPLRLASHRLNRLADEDPRLEEPLGVIVHEADRLEELAAQFSQLGRPPEGPASEVSLGELLAELLATDVPADVAATLGVDPATPNIEAHYEPLLRAFRNLVRNAVEAVRQGGAGGGITVTIAAAAGGGAEVVIADSGPGLPQGAGDRIFEPDFSTKSRGTGLGLALARQAVRQSGGEIEARSRDGGGAEFVVRLPAAPAPAPSP